MLLNFKNVQFTDGSGLYRQLNGNSSQTPGEH